jgi:plastocyanin
MVRRCTPTLAICLIGAGITGALLALPPVEKAAQVPVPVPVTQPGAAPTAVVIEIENFDFGRPRTVAAGADVQVSNADAEAHTMTARNGAFDTGSVDEGTSVTFKAPTVPGTYSFYCDIHPSMTGQLVVD